MRADIGYLDHAVGAAIAATEAGTSAAFKATIERRHHHENVYGFALPEQESQSAAVAENRLKWRSRIDTYRKDANELTVKLRERGIKPLAMITAHAWEKILNDRGLFVLRPNVHGGVSLPVVTIEALRGRARLPEFVVGIGMLLGALAACVTLWFLWDLDWSGDGLWKAAIACFAFLFTMVPFMFAAEAVFARWKARSYAKRVKQFVARPWAEVLDDFTASLTVYDDRYGRGYRSTIGCVGQASFTRVLELPPPPDDIVEIARKLATSPPCLPQIAAEAGAISFKGGIAEMFNAGLEELIAREERARLDPILFVGSGKAVALLGQYGDFPFERAAIDDVLNSEHLLD